MPLAECDPCPASSGRAGEGQARLVELRRTPNKPASATPASASDPGSGTLPVLGGVVTAVAAMKFSLNASSPSVQVVVVPVEVLHDEPPFNVELNVLISHQLEACVAPVSTAAPPKGAVESEARFE